jgi:hypothetical protein
MSHAFYFLTCIFREKKNKMIVESGYPNVRGFKYWCGMLIHIDNKVGVLEGSE